MAVKLPKQVADAKKKHDAMMAELQAAEQAEPAPTTDHAQQEPAPQAPQVEPSTQEPTQQANPQTQQPTQQQRTTDSDPQLPPQKDNPQPQSQEPPTSQQADITSLSREQLIKRLQDTQLQHSQQLTTWQAKYNSEVPRLRGFLREKDGQIQQLTDRLKQLETQQPEPQPVAQPQSPKSVADISDEFIESYVDNDQLDEWGYDFWKQHYLLQLQATQQNQPAQTAVPDRVHALEQRLEHQHQAQFLNELDNLLPQAQQIENDSRFQEWKQDVEPLSQLTYGQILHNAYEAGDASRAAQVMQRFIAESNLFQSSSGNPSVVPKTPIEQQVTPQSAPQTPSPVLPTIRADEFHKRMTEITKGRYSPEEARRKKTELLTAMRDGRVEGVPAPGFRTT